MKDSRAQEVLYLLDDTADIIADRCGMNVPYTESLDMSLLPQLVFAIMDKPRCQPELRYLQFLAQNNRIIPKTIAGCTFEEIKQYCKDNSEEILKKIEEECRQYRSRYMED